MAKSLQEVLQFFGQLDDAGGADSPRERFRRYLRDEVFAPEALQAYVNDCAALRGLQRVRAMQDIVNRIGELLGFEVIHGRYHGDNGPVTIDGHWRSDSGHQYLVEVRAGEMTPLDPARMRNFARLLHMAGKLPELDSIVGIYAAERNDIETGDIQRTLLESPGTPALRAISVGALIRLHELIRASEIGHEDVDRILSTGSVDIDSSILALGPRDSLNPPDMSEVVQASQSTPNSPAGQTPQVSAPRRRSLDEVAAMLEDINHSRHAAADEAAPPSRDAVTGKKEIHLTNIPPMPQAQTAPAFMAHGQQATATALAEETAPGFNATLNDTRMNMMPDLPADSWRDSLTKEDEQLFDSISGTRKKPFINIGLGKKGADKPVSDAAEKTAEKKSADGIFSGIFSGLGHSSKSEKASGMAAENFEQVTVSDLIKPDAGNRVDRTLPLKPETPAPLPSSAPTPPPAQETRVEKPVSAPAPEPVSAPVAPQVTAPAAAPAMTAKESPQPATMAAAPVITKGQPAALEQHDSLVRIVSRLWPYPEFRDYAVDVFTCGAKAHDLARDDVEELLSLVELHSRRR